MHLVGRASLNRLVTENPGYIGDFRHFCTAELLVRFLSVNKQTSVLWISHFQTPLERSDCLVSEYGLIFSLAVTLRRGIRLT